MRKTIFLGAFIVLGCLSIQSRATDQAPDAKQEFLKALQNSKSAKVITSGKAGGLKEPLKAVT